MTREQELVRLFRGSGDDIRRAMAEPCGGRTATALKNLHVSEVVLGAAVAGLTDPTLPRPLVVRADPRSIALLAVSAAPAT